MTQGNSRRKLWRVGTSSALVSMSFCSFSMVVIRPPVTRAISFASTICHSRNKSRSFPGFSSSASVKSLAISQKASNSRKSRHIWMIGSCSFTSASGFLRTAWRTSPSANFKARRLAISSACCRKLTYSGFSRSRRSLSLLRFFDQSLAILLTSFCPHSLRAAFASVSHTKAFRLVPMVSSASSTNSTCSSPMR